MPHTNEPQYLRAVAHETPAAEVLDDLPLPRQHPNLARGIVWADIVAEIAAEEEARRLPKAA